MFSPLRPTREQSYLTGLLGFVSKLSAAAIIGAFMALPGMAGAESLTVSPTSINVPASGQTASLTIRSGGPGVMQGQVRVVRLAQSGGRNVLETTRDVVASPPALRLGANQEATIRLVRTSRAPVQGRECYRVLVDQLPGPRQAGAVVQMTIRHSIPLCFG